MHPRHSYGLAKGNGLRLLRLRDPFFQSPHANTATAVAKKTGLLDTCRIKVIF